LWSTPVYWPQFDRALFNRALSEFAHRQRRFGT